MAGTEILNRLRRWITSSVTRYLPCHFEFCQQELRKGLTLATHKRVSYGQRDLKRRQHDAEQFYNAYIDLLPQKFYLKEPGYYGTRGFDGVIHGLNKLISDAKHMERHGCEQIKNTFWGNEGWRVVGLAQMAVKHGNALHVCTDVECAPSGARIGSITRVDAKTGGNITTHGKTNTRSTQE
jgi:hypothetical protein